MFSPSIISRDIHVKCSGISSGRHSIFDLARDDFEDAALLLDAARLAVYATGTFTCMRLVRSMRFRSTCSRLSLIGSTCQSPSSRASVSPLDLNVEHGVVPGVAVQDASHFLGADGNRLGVLAGAVNDGRSSRAREAAELRSYRAYPAASAAIVISFSFFSPCASRLLISPALDPALRHLRPRRLHLSIRTTRSRCHPRGWIGWPPPAAEPPRAREFCRIAAASSFNGIEFVTTTSSICRILESVPPPVPTSTAWVAQARTLARPCCKQRLDALHQRSRRVDQVVHYQAMPVLPPRR